MVFRYLGDVYEACELLHIDIEAARPGGPFQSSSLYDSVPAIKAIVSFILLDWTDISKFNQPSTSLSDVY